MFRYALFIALISSFVSAANEPSGKTFTVSPEQSIQEAIDKAESGDRIQILPGEYSESLVIEKAGITLVGLEYEGQRTVLDGANELGIAIDVKADGVTVEDMIISGYTDTAITCSESNNVSLRSLVVYHAGLIGIEVTGCEGFTMEQCVVGGGGTALRMVNNIEATLRRNELYGAGTGLVLEDCVKAMVETNSIHHNGNGVLLLGRNEDSNESAGYSRLLYNRIWGNSHAATDRDSDEFPYGFGIVVQAADHTEIGRNYIAHNGSYGIATFSRDYAAQADDLPSETELPDNTDHLYAHHNVYEGNGDNPSGEFEEVFPDVPTGDLYWDGTGMRNQWQETGELKTWPENLVAEQGGVHTEVIHFL